ncbi:MAG: DUF2158 domain-containing protein [Robiginitomaculum sp.]
MSQLIKGEVVRLKSGGPKMTLLQEAQDGKIKCQWFDRNGKMHTAEFDVAMVEKFVPKW